MNHEVIIKAGDRVRLVSMTDDPDPIPVGSLGTVIAIYPHRDWTQVDVAWDSGRTLMLAIPPDCVAIVDPKQPEPSK